MPLLKRCFDIVVTLLAAPLWIPAMIITAMAILLTSGWPVVYLSKRYVLKGHYRTVFKFRTMVKNADKIANRDTVEPEPDKLLHITIDKKLYTPIGLFLEKIYFTELPQLLQVLTGTLSLVGNRPMPENMFNAGSEKYPYLNERFCLPGGITGPAQLAGREEITDTERLELEITYCYLCQESYNPLMDFCLLFITILTPLGLFTNMSNKQIIELLFKFTNQEKRAVVEKRIRETMQ